MNARAPADHGLESRERLHPVTVVGCDARAADCRQPLRVSPGACGCPRLARELAEFLAPLRLPRPLCLWVVACSDAGGMAPMARHQLQIRGARQGFELVVVGQRCVLGRASGERELFEYIGAFLQFFRDEAADGEDVRGFVGRVGGAYVRERVALDVAGRSALFRALVRSLQGPARCLPLRG